MTKHSREYLEGRLVPEMLFPGFSESYLDHFLRYPMELENWWCVLTPSEQKALDLILRLTVGFQKKADRIGLGQFEKGNGKNHRGAGISKSTARRAIKGLEAKGFITTKRYTAGTTYIALRFSGSEAELNTSSDARYIIELFQDINPERVGVMKEDKREVLAAEHLAKIMSIEKLEWLITEVIPDTNTEEFYPTITSPTELLEKVAKLEILMRRSGMEIKAFD